jgi:hypothetical protein
MWNLEKEGSKPLLPQKNRSKGEIPIVMSFILTKVQIQNIL